MLENNTKRRTDQEQVDEHAEPEWDWSQPLIPPVQVFTRGNAVTGVWANPAIWGDVVWTVDQICISYHDGERHIGHSFHEHQLSDAIRGLHASKVWIKRANRRQRIRRLFGWMW